MSSVTRAVVSEWPWNVNPGMPPPILGSQQYRGPSLGAGFTLPPTANIVAGNWESCAIAPCLDMTNLHFHELKVSPGAPQDVLSSVHAFGARLRIDFGNPTKCLLFERTLASVVSNSSTLRLWFGHNPPD